jgi:hypothetical protein
LAEQLLPQSSVLSLPAGVAVTVPGLLRPTDNVKSVLKVAATLTAPLIDAEHVGEASLHAPLQPANTVPDAGEAVTERTVPLVANVAQELPHLMFPPFTEPLPFFVTLNESAVTFTAVFCALSGSPSSPAEGAVHVPSAQTTW